MIKSMTGFGKGGSKNKAGAIKVEARSINHKFLEIGLKLPECLATFEDKVRETVSKFIKRGKVNISLSLEDGLENADKICVDEKLAKTYYRKLHDLKNKMDLEGSIRLDQIITLPGVINYEPKKASAGKLWPCIEAALRGALLDMDKSRLKEGAVIYGDLQKRVRNIEKATAVIKERSSINIRLYKDRLKDSIKQVANGSATPFDKGRLEQEVALYAKNSDVTEEIVRIFAHTRNLSDSLRHDAEVGKKLDFMAQELNREINTVASKASDFMISKKVIQVKAEIEKLREQAKNIE